MKIRMICFTPGGEETLGRILDLPWQEEERTEAFALGHYREKQKQQAVSFAEVSFAEDPRIRSWDGRLADWMADSLGSAEAAASENAADMENADNVVAAADAFVFVGAAGIAIRAIAPYIQHKTLDPALVVVDEKGSFVIPLLSGHIGGANELALRLASHLHAQPVLTTATDVRGLFAVDVFARKNDLYIESMQLAKEVSAALLRGEQIGFVSSLPWSGSLPAGLVDQTDPAKGGTAQDYGVLISYRKELPQKRSRQLQLIPRVIWAGVGCRKGMDTASVCRAVKQALQKAQIRPEALEGIASIDLKKEEPGLIETANEFGVPFQTYSAEALSAVEGTFSESDFVKGITGVDNVCERAAVLASGGPLLMKKEAAGGITVALAYRPAEIQFQDPAGVC